MNSSRTLKATIAGLATCAAIAAAPVSALASGGGIGGGGDDEQSNPTDKAILKSNGKAVAPDSAPQAVKDAIAAGNRIDRKPYRYGGGHSNWKDSGYDCSGAVSYVLGKKGAGLINSPMPSTGFMRWGKKGKGDWITTYADSGHVFVVIAGLRYDTSLPDDGKSGPGWSKNVRDGYRNVSKRAARHSASL